MIFYGKSCGLSAFVCALNELDSIGLRGSGYKTVCVEFVTNQPVCHIYQWVAHPTSGGVCNHCERMMDGFTLDDMISGNTRGSLTEDQIVEYVQNGYPDDRNWDEFPLRMTFHINSLLRDQGHVGEPELAVLGFFDDSDDD